MEVWSPETPGQVTPDDLCLRRAFGQVRALPVATQQRVAPLVEALAAAWAPDARDDGQNADEWHVATELSPTNGL